MKKIVRLEIRVSPEEKERWKVICAVGPAPAYGKKTLSEAIRQTLNSAVSTIEEMYVHG